MGNEMRFICGNAYIWVNADHVTSYAGRKRGRGGKLSPLRASSLSSAPTAAKAARAMILLAVLAIPLMLASPAVPLASAHPYIDQTVPSTAQNAPAGTGEVIVYFSESVDIEFSEIKVINDKGGAHRQQGSNVLSRGSGAGRLDAAP